MKTSKVFKVAKKKLWDGVVDLRPTNKERFICNAITFSPNIPSEDRKRARGIVNSLLGKHGTLEDWLRANHKIHFTRDDSERRQLTRRAWLDHLIAYYESIGD